MMSIPARYAEAHVSPQGVGDTRPAAKQIVADEHMVDGLKGKTILVTGGNTGSGLETVRALHLTGARVFLTARTPEKGEQAVQSIINSNGGTKGGIEALTMELSDLESVSAAAQTFLERSSQLNILVCSAGTAPEKLTWTPQGFESAMGINHFGHFLLFQKVKDLMLNSSTPEFNSRVVMVASVSHRRVNNIRFHDLDFKIHDTASDDWVYRYAHSKTANVYMSNQLERLYGAQGLHSWALQPGGMLSETFLASGYGALAENPHTKPHFKNAEQGAATSVWAAISPDLEGMGGRYLENVQEIGPFAGTPEELWDWTVVGYGEHCYDEEQEKKLWEISEERVKGF